MDNLWLKVENIVSKGVIAHFEQFLLLSLCFQKALLQRRQIASIWGKGLHIYIFCISHRYLQKSSLQQIWLCAGSLIYNLIPMINPFPHTDTFWRLWSRQLLKTLWPIIEIFHFLTKYVQRCLLQISCMWERI